MDYVSIGRLGCRIERAIHAKYIIIGGIITTIILWMASVILNSLIYPVLLAMLAILLPVIWNYENGLRNQQRIEVLNCMDKQIKYPGGE